MTVAAVRSSCRLYRLAELILLFFGLPIALLPIGRLLVPTLLLIAGACLFVLLRDPTFSRSSLGWGDRGSRWERLRRIFTMTGLGCLLLLGGVLVFAPERLFEMVRDRPGLWALVMVGYPLLSVYPQEIMFRAFFFHRYGSLFRSSTALVWTNVAAFAFAHIIFRNYVAIGLTALGGYFFARTYERTRSIVLSGIEHAIYGMFLFTVGLGIYFFAGAPRP